MVALLDLGYSRGGLVLTHLRLVGQYALFHLKVLLICWYCTQSFLYVDLSLELLKPGLMQLVVVESLHGLRDVLVYILGVDLECLPQNTRRLRQGEIRLVARISFWGLGRADEKGILVLVQLRFT